MSSRVVVECTFSSFDKKKRREKSKDTRKIVENSPPPLENEIGKNDKELAVLIKEESLNTSNVKFSYNSDCSNAFLSDKKVTDNNSPDDDDEGGCEYEMKTIYYNNNDELSETVEEIVCE